MRWKLVFAVGRTSCWVPLNSSNVAGAEVRASIFIPSQVDCPSGTIAIATGIAPDVCIAGRAVCLIVIIPPVLIAEVLDGMLVLDALPVIEDVGFAFIIDAAACGVAFVPPWTTCATTTTATRAVAITPANRAARCETLGP